MKRLLFVAVLVIGLIGFGVVQAVSAQDTTPPAPVPGNSYGRGMMGGAAGMGLMHDYMHEALAEKLGLTVEELQALHDDGQTFWQIAESKGYTAEQAQQFITDARSAALAALVKDGTITQEQADWMNSRMGGAMGRGAGGCMGGAGLQNGTTTTPRGGMMGRRGGRW